MKRSLPFLTLALVLVGCPKSTGGQTTTVASDQAKAELEAAKQKAASGDQSAQADLQRLQQQYANTDVGAEALFEAAELDYTNKSWASARDKYRSLLQQYPLFAKADTAKYHLGLCSLQLGDFKDALETLSPLYDRLSPDLKPEAAAALSKAAVGAHQWGEAVRFLAEGEASIADPAQRQKIDQQLYDLVDSQVPQLEIAKLAEELKPQSPAYALVLFKLAKIQFHLHDWNALSNTLQTLQQNAPGNPFSADAQKLLERAQRRAEVKANAVGVLLPLSGKYQRFGESALAGIKLALKGSNVQLVVKDTADDPDKTKQAVQELVLDDQVIAIVGPVISTAAQAAAIEADELGVPLITLSRDESLTDRGPYVYRCMLTNSEQARALVDYAMNVRGFKTFGLMYPTIPYGIELANDFWDDVLSRSGEITGVEDYEHDQTTFQPEVKKLVGRYYLTDRADYLQAAREINESKAGSYAAHRAFEQLRKKLDPIIDFEALFVPDGAKNVGLIAPALAVEDVVTNGCDTKDMENIAKTMGIKNPKDVKTVLLLGANGWDSQDLVDRGGKFVDCSVFVDGFYPNSARPSTHRFVASFQEENQHPPDLLSAYGFDAGLAVKQVVGKSKPTTREAFRQALDQVKNLPGAGGPVTVQGRALEHPLFFLTVDRKVGIKEFTPEEPKAGG